MRVERRAAGGDALTGRALGRSTGDNGRRTRPTDRRPTRPRTHGVRQLPLAVRRLLLLTVTHTHTHTHGVNHNNTM